MEKFAPNPPATVVVAMSGGVDSSVAALILKEQGFDVIGLFMRNWDEEDSSCTATRDYEDVTLVCEQLQIPYYTVNFTQQYWDDVFAECLKEFKQGKTPNPDVLCNREIKFKHLFNKALQLGADYLATGHYCTHLVSGEHHYLGKGLDSNKDQSYFLYTLDEAILKRVMFPIGDLMKSEVKKRAAQAGFVTAAKKESMGVCFIGKRKFRPFLQRFLESRSGDFCTLSGTTVGSHEGAAFYTIGQRKGLNIGGAGEAWFVVGKDMDKNTVFVEQGEDNPALFSKGLRADEVSWVSGVAPEETPFRCLAKIRYRQDAVACTVHSAKEGQGLEVVFDVPQRAITPSQSVVFYEGPLCLGGAKILE